MPETESRETISAMEDRKIMEAITRGKETVGEANYDLYLDEAKRRNLDLTSAGKKGNYIFITWIVYFGISIVSFIIVNILGNLFYEPLMEKGEESLFHFIMFAAISLFCVANFFWFRFCIKFLDQRKKASSR
jgi:hypothetical protein